jgi:hypothetical protein
MQAELAEQAVVLLGLLGLLVGSFLNVVIYRLPKMMERQWEAECAQAAVLCVVVAEANSAARAVHVDVRRELTTTLELASTERMIVRIRVSAWVFKTRQKSSGLGRAMTNEVRVGMTTAICSNVTSALATRSSVKGAPSMVTQPRRVAYLTVSRALMAAAISKRSVPARLDPSDRLPA